MSIYEHAHRANTPRFPRDQFVRTWDAGFGVGLMAGRSACECTGDVVVGLKALGCIDKPVAASEKVEATTLVAVARVLMNLDELINRK